MRLLFHDDDYYRYTPKPWHLFYSLLTMAVGTVTMAHDWIAFGIASFTLGLALGVIIIVGMGWDKSIEYWTRIEFVIEAVSKMKDPTARYELLRSMGYQLIPSQVEVIETRRDDKGIFQGMSIKRLPIPAIVLQTVADKVLNSGKSIFPAEDSQLGKSIPKYRQVKKYLKDNGYLVAINPDNVRLGYAFTKNGVSILYEYASEGVKLELKRKEKSDGT